MKKRILIVIIIFIVIFIILGRFSFSAVKNFTYWQLENNLQANVNYVKSLNKEKVNFTEQLEKLIATNVFDTIFVVNKDEFIGEIDLNIKNNLNKIKSKRQLYINNNYFYYFRKNGTELIVKKGIPKNFWTDIFVNNLLIYYSIIFLFSIIFIYITYLLMIKPLKKLNRSTKEIANGNFHLDIDIEGSKEINDLVDNFKRMKDRILRDIELLQFVINNMKLGFILFNSEGNIILINKEAKKNLKINNKDEINIFDLFTFLNESGELKNKLYSSYKITTKEGEPFYADIVFTSFKWKENFENVIIFKKIQDVTKDQNKKLKSSIEYISYTLAHEIKNPLNVISMILQTLRDKYDEQEMWKDINEEINKINYIINNLLELINYNNEYFKLNPFLDSIMKKWNKLFKEKNIKFNYKLNQNIKLFFDKDKLNIILSNIFKNCYENLSKNDKIVFEEYIDNSRLILAIKDYGKGLNKNDMLKIIEKGYSNKKKGTGWGLYIVKSLMQLHGADFEIESKKDNYTKVRLIFKTYENIDS